MRFAPNSTAQRQTTVATYDVLDTEREADFDNLAFLARTVCRTPIATIGILDADRVWFKASSGMKLDEIALHDSFSAHVANAEPMLVVPDTAENSHFANLPLVQNSGIRFFAGAPLVTRNGTVIGSLNVMDTVPRADFTIEQRTSLQTLAAQVMAQLDLRRTVRDLALALCEKHAALATLSAHTPTLSICSECLTKISSPVSPRPQPYSKLLGSQFGHTDN
jgi:GAF domain-containing protein